MNAANASRYSILKSIGAVLAGFLATAILSIATDLAMRATGVFPPEDQPMSNGLFALATVYRTIYTIVGGYLTARLAPNRPMTHAWILAIIGVLAAIVGIVGTWDKAPEFGPKWYPIALFVVAIPSVLLGGKLAAQRR